MHFVLLVICYYIAVTMNYIAVAGMARKQEKKNKMQALCRLLADDKGLCRVLADGKAATWHPAMQPGNGWVTIWPLCHLPADGKD